MWRKCYHKDNKWIKQHGIVDFARGQNTEVFSLGQDNWLLLEYMLAKAKGNVYFHSKKKLPIVIHLCVMVAKYSSIIEIIEYNMNYAIYLPP